LNLDWFIFGFLIVLMLGQQVFWASIVFKLTNRVMSRDYSEFVRTSRPPQSSPAPSQDAADTIDEQQADQANKVFGLI
jgi:hypothetical protein